VVSNWDCSLAGVLERLGVADRFGAVSASAVVGAPKPDAAIFRHALGALGVAPERALHCGDRPEYDCAGARRAGLRAVLVDRAGRLADGPCPRIAALTELVDWAHT
jgi:putative hydrolase of the HAD superfamily